MTMGEQLRWWGLGLALFCLVLWLLADALTPFLLGAAIAYLTDPLADRLERVGMSRLTATITITVVSIGAGVIALLLVVPVLIDQVRNIIQDVPYYVDHARQLIETWLPHEGDAGGALPIEAFDALKERLQEWSGTVVQGLWSGSVALIDFLLLLFVTPVVAFYLLYDWDRLVAQLDDVTPRQHQPTVHRLAHELDDVLAGFIRGQLTVCLILGSFYAIGLSLIGLKFGLVVGAVAGLVSFIPYVGSILGGAISIGIAIAQFWNSPEWILAVISVFVAGQAVEGNYLTPKLVGGHVKLHPVWLMFALSAFGTVMGFFGMLIAVPAAAAIGVLARFLVEQYKHGRLYQGDGEGPEATAPPRAAAIRTPDASGEQVVPEPAPGSGTMG